MVSNIYVASVSFSHSDGRVCCSESPALLSLPGPTCPARDGGRASEPGTAPAPLLAGLTLAAAARSSDPRQCCRPARPRGLSQPQQPPRTTAASGLAAPPDRPSLPLTSSHSPSIQVSAGTHWCLDASTTSTSSVVFEQRLCQWQISLMRETLVTVCNSASQALKRV